MNNEIQNFLPKKKEESHLYGVPQFGNYALHSWAVGSGAVCSGYVTLNLNKSVNICSGAIYG